MANGEINKSYIYIIVIIILILLICTCVASYYCGQNEGFMSILNLSNIKGSQTTVIYGEDNTNEGTIFITLTDRNSDGTSYKKISGIKKIKVIMDPYILQ